MGYPKFIKTKKCPLMPGSLHVVPLNVCEKVANDLMVIGVDCLLSTVSYTLNHLANLK